MNSLYLCMGSACHQKGVYEVLYKLRELISNNNLDVTIELKGAFCLGPCEDAIILKEFDTTKTLNAVRELSSPYHRFVCFDGHFGQKAIWSDAIKQYLKQTGIGITPYFATHRVDDYLDIMQLLWWFGVCGGIFASRA